MEVWQAQLASDLHSNCYLVLMNEVLKSSWMIEYNNSLTHCKGNVEVGGSGHSAKRSENTGNGATVIVIDDDSGLEVEQTYENAVPDQSVQTNGEDEQNKPSVADSPQTKSIESYEQGTSSSGKATGPHQRPATIIQSPEWLPQGWTTEVRVREWGNTAGTKDKYYVDSANGRRFRSRKEVMEYLRTGHLSRWKRRAKPEPDGYGQPLAGSVVQGECPSASSQKSSVLFHGWSPLQAVNHYVHASSVLHRGMEVDSAGSWTHTYENTNVANNGSYSSSHAPQIPVKTDFTSHIATHPLPVEIIDLEAIPDTAVSTETRPVSANLSQWNPTKELSAACFTSEGQACKDSSLQLNSYPKQHKSQERELHSGNILEGNTNKMGEGCLAPNFPKSNGASTSQRDLLEGASTYMPPVLNNIHINMSGAPCGGFPSNIIVGNNGHSNVTQMSPFPGFGSTLVCNTPLYWQYQMFLPSFAGSQPIGQVVGEAQPPAVRTSDNVASETESHRQIQLHNNNWHVEKDRVVKIALPAQVDKGPACPNRTEKLHKLKRHQEKELLELLGKKLCRESIDFMSKELKTQP